MIKKILFNAAAVAAVCLGATSCSSDEEPILKGGDAAENVIALAFNDGGDNSSRAARPVTSSAAANNVNQVKLAIFVENGTNNWEAATGVTFNVNNEELAEGILDWEPTTKPADAEGVRGDNSKLNRDFTEKLTLKGLAASKKYRIVAYGYNKALTTTITPNGQVFTATPNAGSEVEEIFAGRAEFSTNAEGKITSATTEVRMKRQVAGFLGYFKNIPATVEGTVVKGVRVVASASASAYKFSGTSCIADQNQVETIEATATVFDMAIPADATIDQGIYKFQQKVKGPYVAPNSLLAGKFLVAFAAQEGVATFTVELYDATGERIKWWEVKNGSETSYDVNRNEFYMIGKKYTNGKIPTPTPEDPDPDPTPDPDEPDDPIDLSKDSEILLIVNDLWDVIHELTI